MATKKVLVNLDFGGNQIINVRAEVAASAPANGTPGRFYFNTTQQKLYVYTTSGWQQVGTDLPSGIVTADSTLTADKVILGDGSGKVKASSYTIGASVPSGASFTDENVLQEPTPSSNVERPILFSYLAYSGTNVTGKTYVDSQFTYNPSTHALTLPTINAQSVKVNNNDVATKSYVDTQDQKINDRISNISGFGRYLSGWDMATGEPASLPTTATYTLQSGDYFIINNVPSSGTKYKPDQTGTWTVSQPFAKTSTSESCVVGGYWKFDGSTWSYYAPEQVVSLPSFTNSSKGAIKGNQSSGYVYHDTNDAEGLGKVYGWADKADNSNSHTITLSGDVSGSGSHTNANNNNVTISVTIADGAVTTAKIADGNVTTAKIANDAVDSAKIKAKSVGLPIRASSSQGSPYWEATGNANEYMVNINNAVKNGMVRLCENPGGLYDIGSEVECVYKYVNDGVGIVCQILINSATAPTDRQYYVVCRMEN